MEGCIKMNLNKCIDILENILNEEENKKPHMSDIMLEDYMEKLAALRFAINSLKENKDE